MSLPVVHKKRILHKHALPTSRECRRNEKKIGQILYSRFSRVLRKCLIVIRFMLLTLGERVHQGVKGTFRHCERASLRLTKNLFCNTGKPVRKPAMCVFVPKEVFLCVGTAILCI